MERIKCEQIASGSWLSLQKIHYRDNKGVERVWEAVGRKKSAGAVVMICRLNPSGRIILVRQYRPPADSLVVEFPAGLINPGEDPAEAAVRELREETGIHAEPEEFGGFVVDRQYPLTLNQGQSFVGELIYFADNLFFEPDAEYEYILSFLDKNSSGSRPQAYTVTIPIEVCAP